MDYEKIRLILTTIVPIITVSFLMRYLTRTSTMSGYTLYDQLILKPDKLYGYIGLMVTILINFLSIMVILTTKMSLGGIILLIVIFSTMLSLGIYLITYGFKHKILVDGKKIVSSSFWRRDIEIPLNEITSVNFSKYSMYLSVIGRHSKIKVHLQIVGFIDLIKLLKKNISASLLDKPLDEIVEVYKRILPDEVVSFD